MREERFNSEWPFIFKYTFDFVSSQKVKEYLEKDLFAMDEGSMSEMSESDNENQIDGQAKDDDRKFDEMSIEIGFDIFSFLS